MFYPWDMSHSSNGIGQGSNGTAAKITRKPPASPPPTEASSATHSQVTFKTHEGSKLNGVLSNFTRFVAVIEIYGGHSELRVSERLEDFQVSLHGRVIYAGKAVVQKLVNQGSKAVCEATLEESGWKISIEHLLETPEALTAEFKQFFQDWQKVYKVSSEFKVAVVDLQMFLHNLQLWLDQIELQVRALPSGQAEAEQKILTSIGKTTTPLLNEMFEKFEEMARVAGSHAHAVQSAFAKRMLHSLLLCSPFLHRTFTKPLGYAGDYEMVNMLARNPLEGDTFFAKIVNLWFWEQAPAAAHRNRLTYLERRINEEAMRLMRRDRKLRVFNFACGPAQEIQQFLRRSPLINRVEFYLADFNQETLDYTRRHFRGILQSNMVESSYRFQKKSVQQLLKESDKIAAAAKDAGQQYDLVYCAGLFDYLTDRTCLELMNAFYNFVAPGGVLLATNVDSSNPRRPTMDMIMEWHLIYRDAKDFMKLCPENAPREECSIVADATGVNIFLECRKPDNA